MTETPKPQIDKFKDLAREVGADTSERRFKDALKKVAKAPAPRGRDGGKQRG